jgi:sugar O-acyltransferase (sialic acid O-acetyltransferase NeuD family)
VKRAVIFGAADFAEVAKVYLDADSPYTVCAFAVHERYIGDRTTLLGLPVVPFERLGESHPPEEYEVFVAVGFSNVNRTRTALVAEVQSKGYRLLTYVSSRASHVGHFTIGANSFVLENNVIQPFVSIGDNTIVWSGNVLGHHSTIGNNCFLASQIVISGRCTIGDGAFIGVGATVRHGITVAPQCVIGAGALILEDTEPRSVYGAKGTEAAKVTSERLRSL